MHETRKTIIERLKSLLQTIGSFSSTLGGKSKKLKIIHLTPTGGSPTPYHQNETYPILSYSPAHPSATVHQAEVYLPAHVWDALDPAERFPSVADLCAHISDQLPIQVVRLIARDVLRGLEHRGSAHDNINPNNILLSPTDLRALISQLRTETQASFRPSELSVGIPFSKEGFPSPDMTAVFTLSNSESQDRNPRPEYPDRQALQAPEALLGATSPCRANAAADMWALGCVLFELLTGEALFDPIFQTQELNISREESHLIQMVELFGEMPVDLIKAGQSSDRWFTEDGALRIETTYYPISLGAVLERHLEKSEVLGTAAFLDKLLQLRPEDRSRPEDLVDDPWFSN